MSFSLSSIKKNLLIKYPLFGSVLANVKFVEDNSIATAATDGNTIHYNSNFLSSLNEKEQTFVLAHEVCHIAFDHVLRSEGKNPKIWNIATDAVINALLNKDGLPLIDGVVDIPEAINFNAEQMYQRLLKKSKENNSVQNDQMKNDDNGQENPESHDSLDDYEDVNNHDMWERTIENNKEDDINKNNFRKNSEQEKITQKFKSVGETKVFEKNKVVRKKQLEKLRDSIIDNSFGFGTGTGRSSRDVSEIGDASSLIDWKKLLAATINSSIDWSYKNATIEDGVVTPHLEEYDDKSRTEIVLDTSGSVSPELLKNFLKECKNILKNSEMHVGCFDVEFYGFKQIRSERDIDNYDCIGGGGTDFDVAISAFTPRAENKIIFTDGDAPMPDSDVSAIWVVFGEEQIYPRKGKVIYIDEEALEKLNSKSNSKRR